jgi:hypothetical protein
MTTFTARKITNAADAIGVSLDVAELGDGRVRLTGSRASLLRAVAYAGFLMGAETIGEDIDEFIGSLDFQFHDCGGAFNRCRDD